MNVEAPKRAVLAIGDFVRQERQARGLSMEKLAVKAGVSLGTVRKLETGQIANPGLFTLLGICEVLELDLIEILDVATDD